MYDDIDLSGGMFDFEGGSPLLSQQESMYIEDDEFYPEDYYYAENQQHVGDALSEVGRDDISDSDDGSYYERISVSELVDRCVGPTLSQAFGTIYQLLGLCIVCRLTCLFCVRGKYFVSLF